MTGDPSDTARRTIEWSGYTLTSDQETQLATYADWQRRRLAVMMDKTPQTKQGAENRRLGICGMGLRRSA